MIPLMPLILGLAVISLVNTLYWGHKMKLETQRLQALTKEFRERNKLDE